MTNTDHRQHRYILQRIAHQMMLERGLVPDFPIQSLADHARHNTTSGYTVAEIFPMLTEKLSADLTSLSYESGRRAVVISIERNALDAN